MATSDCDHVLTQVEQALGASGLFEPIWSTRHGRYEGYYAVIDDDLLQVRHMVPGATQLEAANGLLSAIREIHPALFSNPIKTSEAA